MSYLPSVSIDWDNGLVPNRQQAIIWTNGDIIYRCIYVSFGLNGLRNQVPLIKWPCTMSTAGMDWCGMVGWRTDLCMLYQSITVVKVRNGDITVLHLSYGYKISGHQHLRYIDKLSTVWLLIASCLPGTYLKQWHIWDPLIMQPYRYWYRWFSARLQWLQCVSNGVTAVLH